MFLRLDDEGCGFDDDAEQYAYGESKYDSQNQGFCVHISLLREKKGGGVCLSYPRYGGSVEFKEPLACEFALWHFEVGVEATVYSE